MEEEENPTKKKKTSTSKTLDLLQKKKKNDEPSIPQQATYYGDNRGAGACSYQFSGVNGEPWVDGVAYRVALNSRQWLNSEPCGMCLKFRGFSKGAGANPVTNVTRYVMVTNLCPECYSGDLDQELPGDGRWIIEWEPVQCNVGYTPFVYSFQGSNGYFMKFQVRLLVLVLGWRAGESGERVRGREDRKRKEGREMKKREGKKLTFFFSFPLFIL